MKTAIAFTLILALASTAMPDSRIASDFEIAEAQRQLAKEHDPLDQMAARLNLGDLYASRQQTAAGRDNYRAALDLAAHLRERSRKVSDLSLYATATSYLGLAEAKLGDREASFAAFEEAVRYSSDSSRTWNLYSSAMSMLGLDRKATAAASNAVRIAEASSASSPSVASLLDLSIYRYTLAAALEEEKRTLEAMTVLQQVISTLQERRFDGIRNEVAGHEQFEVFSIVRGDAGAYLSLLNRSRLRLARLEERAGDLEASRAEYGRVLQERDDDPVALEAMARLAGAESDKERYFAASFNANPFSLDLIRQYTGWLTSHGADAPRSSSPGDRMRRALIDAAAGDSAASDRELAALSAIFPGNETVAFLEGRNAINRGEQAAALDILKSLHGDARAALREALDSRSSLAALVPAFLTGAAPAQPFHPTQTELSQLEQLLLNNALSPAQKTALDSTSFVSTVTFDEALAGQGTTTLEQGLIGPLRFRFSSPVTFRGTFQAHSPLTLTYAVVGASGSGDSAALLLEPQEVSP